MKREDTVMRIEEETEKKTDTEMMEDHLEKQAVITEKIADIVPEMTIGVVVTTETRCMFCHAAAYKISPHLCTGWVLSDKYPSCIHLLSAY